MAKRGLESDSQGVSPVIGVVLMVSITVLLATTVGMFVVGIGDSGPDAPQYTTIEVDSVEKSENGIHLPQADGCEYYHFVARLTHTEGSTLESSELEYVIDVSGDDGTTLSGRFNETVARSGVTASAGEEIIIALDSDTDYDDCGDGSSDSMSTVLFGDQPAWHPDEAGQVGGLWNIYATFLDDTETLTEVQIRIVHTPSDTILVDETYDDIVDVT